MMTFHSWSKIVTLVIGVFVGVMLYQSSSFRWLYVVDAKYLTFTQARMTQSLGRLLDIEPEGKNEDFIIFGGSGAYHSINHHYLNDKFFQKGSDKRAHLVSFSSQSLVNTLALVNYLPQRTGKPAHVIITWSFWRFDAGFVEDLEEYFQFNRTFDSSEELLSRLDGGDYDYMFENSPLAPDWKTLKREANLPQKDRLSTWSKYFLLDKIQKIQKDRLDYLFIDPPATPSANVFSERSLKRLNETLEKPSILARNEKQKEKLSSDAEKKFSFVNNPSRRDEVLTYIHSVLPEIARISKSKGYKVWLYQLPTYRVATQNTPIPAFQTFLEKEIRLLNDYDANVFYEPSDYYQDGVNILEQPKKWWDFVHMTNIGAHLFQDNLLSQLDKLSNDINREGIE